MLHVVHSGFLTRLKREAMIRLIQGFEFPVYNVSSELTRSVVTSLMYIVFPYLCTIIVSFRCKQKRVIEVTKAI